MGIVNRWLIKHVKREWCIPCMLIGVLLFLDGTVAVAQSQRILPTARGEFVDWFNILTGLVVALGAAYMRGLSSRISENKIDIKEIGDAFEAHRMDIATKHYTKSEIENVVEKLERSLTIQFVEMKSSNHAIHRRLDNLHVPSVFPKD